MPVPNYVPIPKIIDFCLTDRQNNKIDKANIGDIVFLYIKTFGLKGKKISIKLDNPEVDFEYEDKILTNDTLKDYLVKYDEEFIKLKIVKP